MSNSYTTCMQHARNIQNACSTQCACCMSILARKHVACLLPKMQHACHMQLPGNNNNSKKKRFCSSLSQTCVGSCDSLSQPCTKIPVCDKVLPDCHNLETRLLIACFLYTSLLQPCHMLVQPCHFCMGTTCIHGTD